MLRSAVFLLPLLMTLVLAESADGPERWEEAIRAFETRDRRSPPPEGALLFVGSSSIRMWELEKSWPEVPAINNGFGGSTLADAIHHFDRLIAPYEPAAVILYAGDNDVARGLSAREVTADFERLADLIRRAHPDAPVVFIAIKPSRARWDQWSEMKAANESIAARCRERGRFFFANIAAPMLGDGDDPPPARWFQDDGLHLSPRGYREWTRVIRKTLEAAGVLP